MYDQLDWMVAQLFPESAAKGFSVEEVSMGGVDV